MCECDLVHVHHWPLAFKSDGGGVEADLTLPREEDADGSLAGVRCRVTGRIIVDLRTCETKRRMGGRWKLLWWLPGTVVQLVCCSAASLASGMTPFMHTEQNESRISEELKLVTTFIQQMDASQESSSSKDILAAVIKAGFYTLSF